MDGSGGREWKVRPLDSVARPPVVDPEPDRVHRDSGPRARRIVIGLLFVAVFATAVAWAVRHGSGTVDLTAVPIGSADEFPIGLVKEIVLDVGYTDLVGVEDPPPGSPPVQKVLQTRLFVMNLPGLGLLALNQRSPFRGCRLVEVTQAETAEMLGEIPEGFGGGFFDPCHGGLFALDGRKLAGPGDRNLDAFAVRSEPDGTVVVDLTQLLAVNGAEPRSTAPATDSSGSTTATDTVATADASAFLSPQDFICPVTVPASGFLAPEPWLTQYPARSNHFWYGTDGLWTILPIRPDEYGPRKSVWWSVNFPGGDIEEKPYITVTWRRLGGDEILITAGSPGTNAGTADEGWFLIAGIDPEESGCWEVTATYKGASVTYVYEKG